MNDIVAAAQANLPAHLQGAVTGEMFDEYAGGVTSGFPIIGFKGKVWSFRKGGESTPYVDAEGNPMHSIEVVLLRSNERPSKTYYEGSYKEGDQEKPRCWSSNGIKPDSGVINPIHPMCQACPMNQWGSKVTDQGKSTRACADVRRVAVCSVEQLEQAAAGVIEQKDVEIALLRVPAASLNPLKDYAEQVLKPKGIPPFVLGTKIGFDVEVAYPKFTFKGSRFLSEPEFAIASQLRESDEAKRVLNESQENVEAAGTPEGQSEAGGGVTSAAPEAPAAAPAASSKPVPVAEEIAPAPAPEPPRAAEVEQQAAEVEVVDDIAPAPAPEPPVEAESQPAPEAVAAAPAEAPAAPAAPASGDGDEDFDALLDDVLNVG